MPRPHHHTFEQPVPRQIPETPSETPEQEFRRLQAELRAYAQQFADRKDIPAELRQEVVGAAYEQPPFAAEMTVVENKALRDLLRRAAETLESLDASTVH